MTIITPGNVAERGSQLSLVFLPTGRGVMPRVLKGLEARGVVGDSRKPDVIRLAPAPLYNTFEDVERAVRVLDEVLAEVWPAMEKIPIDNAVAEPAALAGRVAVVPATFGACFADHCGTFG